jgi:OST-HTH/LOTUS domain
VIGVGVKSSTSDLLIANCDEFIYYDDLVRQEERKKQQRTRRKPAAKQPAEAAKDPQQPKREKTEEDRKQEAFDLLLDTIDALAEERDQDEKIWGSMVKQALKRRNPGFNESYYGFRTFSDLLEEAQVRKLLLLEPDQKSGGYVIRRVT